MMLSSPIDKLKRQAKLLARDDKLSLHQALNHIAKQNGFSDWSHLASDYASASPAKTLLRQLKSGDLVLLGARPGQGKTLLGLELAALADKINRSGYVFTLDYNAADVWDRLTQLGFDPNGLGRQIMVDTSDNISAAYIAATVPETSDDALIVVDYLQLLDQRRSNPPLDIQIRALKAFAAKHGAIVVVISQIDRAFELTANTFPGITDIRRPNPVDLTLFDKLCFLQDGNIKIETAA